MVCGAVAGPGKAPRAAIFLAESGSCCFKPAAGSDELRHLFENPRVSFHPQIPEGQGLAGAGFSNR